LYIHSIAEVRLAVPRLTSGTNTEKERVSEMLCGIIQQGGVEVGSMVIGEGAIKPLIQLLSSGTARGKELAATVMSELALYDFTRYKIVGAGVIPPLVKLCSSGNDKLHGSAACALANITVNSRDNALLVVKAGAIKPLTQLVLSAGLDATQQVAVQALIDITSYNDDDIDNALFQAGAIKSIVRSLKSGHATALPEALLGFMAVNNSKIVARIVEEGAIKPLVKLVTSGSYAQQVCAARVLVIVAQTQDYHEQLAQDGAIHALITLLKTLPVTSHPMAAYIKHLILSLLHIPSSTVQQVAEQAFKELNPNYNDLTSSAAQTSTPYQIMLNMLSLSVPPTVTALPLSNLTAPNAHRLPVLL
jgi:hypothetical protein